MAVAPKPLHLLVALVLPVLTAARLGGANATVAAVVVENATLGAGTKGLVLGSAADAGANATAAAVVVENATLGAGTKGLVLQEPPQQNGSKLDLLETVHEEEVVYRPEANLNYLNASSDVSALSAGGAVSAQSYGFRWAASTTVYGWADRSSCGSLDTHAVTQGTGYYAVASAQAMQSDGPHDGTWCGRANSNCASRGTAPMGCFTCGRGRFLKTRPQSGNGHENLGFASREVKFVVLDICPHTGNVQWCPAGPGQINHYGSKNHLDFSSTPGGIDNNYFVFETEACPDRLRSRMARGLNTCSQPER